MPTVEVNDESEQSTTFNPYEKRLQGGEVDKTPFVNNGPSAGSYLTEGTDNPGVTLNAPMPKKQKNPTNAMGSMKTTNVPSTVSFAK
jgi:hypothetical protein